MKKWVNDYLYFNDLKSLKTVCDQQGDHGWEVVSVFFNVQNASFVAWLKREIPEPKTDTDIEMGLDRPIFDEGEPPAPEALMTDEEILNDPRR